MECFLYSGFAILLAVLVWEDGQNCFVDDRKILLGIVFVLTFQILLGRGWFAVKGAVTGGMIGGMMWGLGRFIRGNMR